MSSRRPRSAGGNIGKSQIAAHPEGRRIVSRDGSVQAGDSPRSRSPLLSMNVSDHASSVDKIASPCYQSLGHPTSPCPPSSSPSPSRRKNRPRVRPTLVPDARRRAETRANWLRTEVVGRRPPEWPRPVATSGRAVVDEPGSSRPGLSVAGSVESRASVRAFHKTAPHSPQTTLPMTPYARLSCPSASAHRAGPLGATQTKISSLAPPDEPAPREVNLRRGQAPGWLAARARSIRGCNLEATPPWPRSCRGFQSSPRGAVVLAIRVVVALAAWATEPRPGRAASYALREGRRRAESCAAARAGARFTPPGRSLGPSTPAFSAEGCRRRRSRGCASRFPSLCLPVRITRSRRPECRCGARVHEVEARPSTRGRCERIQPAGGRAPARRLAVAPGPRPASQPRHQRRNVVA